MIGHIVKLVITYPVKGEVLGSTPGMSFFIKILLIYVIAKTLQ